MPIRFTEQHAASLALSHLAPGESVVYRARGVERPWWTRLLFVLGTFFWRDYLLVATQRRLLLLRHKGLFGGYAAKSCESTGWDELELCDLGWGVFRKTLHLATAGKRWRRTIALHRFRMKGNFPGAKGIVSMWQHHQAFAQRRAPAFPPHARAA